MNTIEISNPVQREFSMVPNALWSIDPAQLGFDAKAMFAFLLSLRDGVCIRVAEIEATLGIGRDKRRKAMAQLQDNGLIARQIGRRADGQIVTDKLVVNAGPLMPGGSLNRGPEIQAHGEEMNRGPEKPAGGKSTPAQVETRPCTGGNSGGFYKTKTKQRASVKTDPRKRAGRSPHESGSRPVSDGKKGVAHQPQLADLSDWQLSKLRQGNEMYIDGKTVLPTNPLYMRLADDLRALRDCETVSA